MINQKKLREVLEKYLVDEVGHDPSDVREEITIKRKKKMIIVKTPNGKVRTIRKNVIKIKIIE